MKDFKYSIFLSSTCWLTLSSIEYSEQDFTFFTNNKASRSFTIQPSLFDYLRNITMGFLRSPLLGMGLALNIACASHADALVPRRGTNHTSGQNLLTSEVADFVKEHMDFWKIPGMAIAVVDKDDVFTQVCAASSRLDSDVFLTVMSAGVRLRGTARQESDSRHALLRRIDHQGPDRCLSVCAYQKRVVRRLGERVVD